jgi:serine/threonine protein kinase
MPSMWGDAEATLVSGKLLFGKYLLVRKLGEGGMGEVWLVRHHDLEIERALKLIVSSVAFDKEMRSRFRREARVMARFGHPNAVAVHDAVIRPDGNAAYIEMEYVKGQSLNKILKPGVPMPLEWIIRIATQLCSVLQVAHEQGIVHRDLKPSNLMLLEGPPPGQEHLKVLDFGIAKILGESREQETLVTRPGTTLGTPQYMSPEQISSNSGELDGRSDLYSVGLILYEMLTGYRPFDSKLHKLIYDTMETPPPPFSAKNRDLKVPAEVERVVLRCLEKSPARRPQSARELSEALRKAAGLQDIGDVSTERRPRRRTILIVLALSVPLALSTIFMWPRAVSVPAGCVADRSARLERIRDRWYPVRVERVLSDGTRIPFLLIKQDRSGEPEPFYIMETKTWNGLFARFCHENKSVVADSEVWRPISDGKFPEGWDDQLPALNMTADQAHRCALWLGGKLPTVEQWDKAAGLYDRGDRTGPYLGTWDYRDKLAIAVARDRPLPVGTARQDLSPNGCRDMAGNGLEWTRTPMTSAVEFPPPPGSIELILTRGRRFSAPGPLRYDDLRDRLKGDAGEFDKADEEIGFRVVIELDLR